MITRVFTKNAADPIKGYETGTIVVTIPSDLVAKRLPTTN